MLMWMCAAAAVAGFLISAIGLAISQTTSDPVTKQNGWYTFGGGLALILIAVIILVLGMFITKDGAGSDYDSHLH